MKVKILKYYPFEVKMTKPRLLAYVDVEIEDLFVIIKGVKFFESKHGGYFIQMPDCIEIKSRALSETIRKVISDYYKKSVRSSVG